MASNVFMPVGTKTKKEHFIIFFIQATYKTNRLHPTTV